VIVIFDDDNWDTTFFEELGNDQNCEEVAGRDSDDEDGTQLTKKNPQTEKLQVVALEDEALSIGCTFDRIVNLKHAMHQQDKQHYLTISLTNSDLHMHKLYFC